MPHTLRFGYPVGNLEAMIRYEDLANAKEEQDQNPFSNIKDYPYSGLKYSVKNHFPSKYRTYINEQGEQVIYPRLLMVHGVASDASYFDPFCQDMARLGIASSVVELPRTMTAALKGKKLLDWQAGAFAHTYELLKETNRTDGEIILAGHSRGAIVATMAAEELYDHDFYRPKGLVLLAPAGIDKIADGKIHKGVKLLGPLVVNNLVSSFGSESLRVKKNASMLARVILKNIPQSFLEVKQAMNVVVVDKLKNMRELEVFIPFAENDEFINYKELYSLALKNRNLSVETVESSHMLDNPSYEDMISLSDTRLLTGQVLAFMQSLISNYSTKVYLEKYGATARLTDINLSNYIDNDLSLADSN